MSEVQPQEVESDEVKLLANQRNVTIGNYIVHRACQLYFFNFHKKLMPMSFVEFYFSEFKRYDTFSVNPLLDFFKVYKPINIPEIIENYEYNFFSLITDKRKRGEEVHYKLSNSSYMYLNLSDKSMFGDYDPELYTNLDNIAKRIAESDELMSIRDLYEAFMIRKVVLARSSRRKMGSANNPKVSAVVGAGGGTVEPAIKDQQQTAQTITDDMLIGSESNLPNQHGRVVRMYFPRLSLPSPYPILQDKSRINSEHRAKKFMSTDREVLLLNRVKFKQVKYKTGFIEKRKAAQKAPKRKFDFDF